MYLTVTSDSLFQSCVREKIERDWYFTRNYYLIDLNQFNAVVLTRIHIQLQFNVIYWYSRVHAKYMYMYMCDIVSSVRANNKGAHYAIGVAIPFSPIIRHTK